MTESHAWALFAWSVVAYTAGCGAVMWLTQRRVGVSMAYFDARTRAVFACNVLALSALIALACWLDLDRGLRGDSADFATLREGLGVAGSNCQPGRTRSRSTAMMGI